MFVKFYEVAVLILDTGAFLTKCVPMSANLAFILSGQCSQFIPTEDTRKTKGFLVFSGSIELEHWPEMD